MRDNIQLDLIKTGGDQNDSVSCSILQALGKHIKFHRKQNFPHFHHWFQIASVNVVFAFLLTLP
jgi:hypothetical protein